jgi:hypothetical protein
MEPLGVRFPFVLSYLEAMYVVLLGLDPNSASFESVLVLKLKGRLGVILGALLSRTFEVKKLGVLFMGRLMLRGWY